MKEVRICPVCKRKFNEQSLLTLNGKRLVCAKNHSFDLASGGYVNLLPPSAGQHGDNRSMVLARRLLLNTGLYRPLREALADQVNATLPNSAIIWDSGCGEGYYTSALTECGNDYTVYGSDLSTAALIESHKRSAAWILSAASSYDLPVADHSCDAVICLFAPQALDEFVRILKPGGLLFLGFPGKRHLFGLKEVLYDTPYENATSDTALPNFDLIQQRELYYRATLPDRESIQSLFEMTPYAYRTGINGRKKLECLEALDTEIHFHLLTYQVSYSTI